MYAQLCKRLEEEAPNFEPPGKTNTFRLLLLNKCKLEFDSRCEAVENHGNGIHNDEEEERRQLAKRKMLGNIKFMGELGKLEILSEGILHKCIQELFKRRGDDPSEDLECLCQIMRTCGRILDSDKGENLMEQYFQRMKLLTENQDLPPRIRFMLKDVIDLRQDGWIPRKATIVEGPMPINEIRPVDDNRSSYINRRDRNYRDRDSDRTNNITDIFSRQMIRSGLDDIMMMSIGNLAPTTTTTNLISSNSPFGANGFGSGQRDNNSYRGHNNQRSSSGVGGGYNNFNNTNRGQYNKHNQNSNINSQYNNQTNKEIAPRFKKNLIVTKEQIDDVELRPNSMLFNKASTIKTNNIMNNRQLEQSTFTQSLKQPPLPLLKEQLPIKQVSVEKPKQSKKDKGPTKDDVLKKFSLLLDDYWKGEHDLKQTINIYKEEKIPEKFLKDIILNGLLISLDKSNVEQEKFIKFLSNLKEDNAINQILNLQETFKQLLNLLDERENEINKAINGTAILLSESIIENLINLNEVASLTDNGQHYPLFMIILQQLYKKRGKTELNELFNKSKINLLTQLPENDKTKERLSEILEEYDLTFLYPLLRIQADLAKQLQIDPNPQSYYRWIKDNLDPTNFTDPGFINALMTVLLKYITQEAAAAANGDDKAVGEKEKSMLERYQYILRSFLSEKHHLQLVAVYSLQVHFYSLGFPRGQLLRWFMALYDLEIVDEEAFLNWKEDVTDAYPGKGQALFQVNQWLTWLQEAESEEEEGED